MFDSHAHIIADDSARYPPAPPSGSLKPGELDNPMTAERLLGDMDAAGVKRAVLVQRGSIYGFDSSYVCASAARYPDRFAAVCSIDGTAADADEAVRRWVGEFGAAGVRFMELIKGSDLSWLASPSARKAWRTAASLKTPVCVHFFPWNRLGGLAALKEILAETPDLTVVIDHFSNMNTQSGAPDYGLDQPLMDVAAFPGVHVKFTTVPLGRLHDAGIDAAPIVARVVEAFGARRVMWGSDITQSPGTYDHMVSLGRSAAASLSEADRAQVFEGAVQSVYGHGWR
ncbi:MAG: amidohydrolase [Hyphomonadaceae bacterium]|nr:amidohydrolase [Hyphomonadaceae bacterium]